MFSENLHIILGLVTASLFVILAFYMFSQDASLVGPL